jgi:hypothetical protein
MLNWPHGAGAALGADRTEQVGRFGTLIAGGTGAMSPYQR